MTNRDRLIELIKNAPTTDTVYGDIKLKTPAQTVQTIADYLLANGVIVPPCKVGDKIYYPSASFDRIFEKTVDEIMIHNIDGDIGCYVHFASNYMPFENIGKTVFLTKEEAEKKLKELNNNA